MAGGIEYELAVEQYDEWKRWAIEERLISAEEECMMTNGFTYYFSEGKEGNVPHECDECGDVIFGTDDCWVITMDNGKEYYHCLQCQPKEGVL